MYKNVQAALSTGWNTWNTRSMLSHVRLPDRVSVDLGVKEYAGGAFLTEATVGPRQSVSALVLPGMHSYDGSYSDLSVQWKHVRLRVQTAHEGDDLVILADLVDCGIVPPSLTVAVSLMWGTDGTIVQNGGAIRATTASSTTTVWHTGEVVEDPIVPLHTAHVVLRLDGSVGVSTGQPRSIDLIRKIVARERHRQERLHSRYGTLASMHEAMQCAVAWNTIYDPTHSRVITPVSRLWNVQRGGHVLFCWDTYLCSYMASLDNRELSYANAVEMTAEATEDGFVPNFSTATGYKSRDRSQPPLGGLVVREVFRRYRESWFVEQVFDSLFSWNTWFFDRRQPEVGMLAWGSNPYEPVTGNYWETAGVGETAAAALESGMDNSPVYDDVPFNTVTGCMELADVGLMSLFIMDCACLEELAIVIGRHEQQRVLEIRRKTIEDGLRQMWDDDLGLYLNRRLDDGTVSQAVSPANLYALLTDVPSEVQVRRMVDETLADPERLGGAWVLPSITRDHPAHEEQDYWRGRIWPPLNFLVYLGLRHQGEYGAATSLAEKSSTLLLREWTEHRHLHENYSSIDGAGCDKPNSDPFYHWAGLLAMMSFIESGVVPAPEESICGEEFICG